MDGEKAKAKRGESQKSGDRKKRTKLSSVKRKSKDGKRKTQSRKRKSKHGKEKKRSWAEDRHTTTTSSSTTSSASNTPTGSRSLTPVRERENERDKEKEKEKEREKEREKEAAVAAAAETIRRNSRVDSAVREWKEEKEPESEHDGDLVVKKSHAAIHCQKDMPRKIEIKHAEVRDDDIKSLLVKLKEDKLKMKPLVLLPMDEKAKLLMDRVTKNRKSAAGVLKYTPRRTNEKLDDGEDEDYFLPKGVGKVRSKTAIVPEDSYDHVIRLSFIQTLPEEPVFERNHMGAVVPFWAVYLEPSLDDMIGVEEPISVGSDVIQEYHDKKIELKKSRNTKLLLDEMQPMAMLQKRDEDHFHPHLVFSNSIRSLVNVQADAMRAMEEPRKNHEDRTQSDEIVGFANQRNLKFTYDRSNPILSARTQKHELHDRLHRRKRLSEFSSTQSE